MPENSNKIFEEEPQAGYDHQRHYRWGRGRSITTTGTTVITKQSMAKACDVNAIMAKYHATGVMPYTQRPEDARYGDFSQVDDYLSALNRVRAAQEGFDALPAHIRTACRNDPAELIDMATNPDRAEELQALGLAPEAEPNNDRSSHSNVESEGDNPEANATTTSD